MEYQEYQQAKVKVEIIAALENMETGGKQTSRCFFSEPLLHWKLSSRGIHPGGWMDGWMMDGKDGIRGRKNSRVRNRRPRIMMMMMMMMMITDFEL